MNRSGWRRRAGDASDFECELEKQAGRGVTVESTVSPRGRTVTLDVDVDAYSIAPVALWNSGHKILGAEFGVFGVIPFGGPSIQVHLATQTGAGINTDDSAFGLQDIYVQPLWLAWR
jgi:hypothetical protein